MQTTESGSLGCTSAFENWNGADEFHNALDTPEWLKNRRGAYRCHSGDTLWPAGNKPWHSADKESCNRDERSSDGNEPWIPRDSRWHPPQQWWPAF